MEQVIGRGGLEVRIDVSIGPRVLNCVIGECLMKTYSIETVFTAYQGVHKIRNFSDAILREALDSVDEFLLFHSRKYSTVQLERRASAKSNASCGREGRG